MVTISWIVTIIFLIRFLITWGNAAKIQTPYGSPSSSPVYILGMLIGAGLIPGILWLITYFTAPKGLSILSIFRIIAISEGISYLALLANMLFVKPSDLVLYKSLLYPIGMTHGVLFIGYIVQAILLKKSQKWSLINLGIILFASLLPFATFVIERKYLKRDIHVDK